MAGLVCDGSGNISVQEIVDAVNLNALKLQPWIGTLDYIVGDFIYNTVDGYYYQATADNIGSQPEQTSSDWLRWSPVNYLDVDFEITVGADGDWRAQRGIDLSAHLASVWSGRPWGCGRVDRVPPLCVLLATHLF